MRIVIFLVSSLTVCGFYVYVLARLYREERRLNARKKHLQEHLYEMELETPSTSPKKVARSVSSRNALRNRGTHRDCERPRFYSAAATAPESNAEAKARKETMISLVLGVGGLAALFAGIELFNSVAIWSH
jgi:hypothetical protein